MLTPVLCTLALVIYVSAFLVHAARGNALPDGISPDQGRAAGGSLPFVAEEV